ncbi:MAG: glycoside hydrolase family 55 protein [Chloroflexi bacterium]|nr:glycoside hydrolase family 55 protein [Chloroflexota bacterium]
MNHPINAMLFGTRGDGITDDTAALQSALDAASALGGIVQLSPGQYRITSSIRIPIGVHLQGAALAPQYIKPLTGTVIMACYGRDDEQAPALFELGDSCSVSGLTLFYPEQKPRDIRPYPYTFHLVGGDNTVENVTLINSYNGIKIGPASNVRHRIRSVYGCVLRRGIWLDNCSDIGRLDNVQFHCHWWSAPEVGGEWEPVFEYMWRNCEAFVFGRSDWEYVTNTFVFPVHIGYRFIETEHGATNAQLCGIGADAAERCIVVDKIQYMGLLITNGQFVAFPGDNPIEIVINATCQGSVRLVNCAFWGPADQCVVSHSQSFVSLSDCFFSSGRSKALTSALVEVDGGRLQMRSCSFATPEPSIHLKQGVIHAIVSENNGTAGVTIRNEAGNRVTLTGNELPLT